MPDWDNDMRLDDEGGCYGNEPRIVRDKGKPYAPRDGYTVVARRVQGDQPGYWTDADQADEIDRMVNEGGPYAYPMPFGGRY